MLRHISNKPLQKITTEAIIFWDFCAKSKKRFPNNLQNGGIELVHVTWVLGC